MIVIGTPSESKPEIDMNKGGVFTSLIALSVLTGACEDEIHAEQPSGAVTEDASSTSARAFIEQVFGAYSPGGRGLDWENPSPVFEPLLASAISRQVAEAEATMSIPDALAGDPLCGCQDWEDLSYSIRNLEVSGTKGTAELTIENFGATQQRTIDLVLTDAGWRVHDIDGRFRQSVLGTS